MGIQMLIWTDILKEVTQKEKVPSRPLNSGRAFSFQVAVSCALSTREQMYSIFAFCVQPFVISFYGSQLLMSLMATMMAMITMSTTRMMSR